MTTNTTTTQHDNDRDCAGHLDDGDCCTVCGVYHGDPCDTCDGRGYHEEGCPCIDDMSVGDHDAHDRARTAYRAQRDRDRADALRAAGYDVLDRAAQVAQRIPVIAGLPEHDEDPAPGVGVTPADEGIAAVRADDRLIDEHGACTAGPWRVARGGVPVTARNCAHCGNAFMTTIGAELCGPCREGRDANVKHRVGRLLIGDDTRAYVVVRDKHGDQHAARWVPSEEALGDAVDDLARNIALVDVDETVRYGVVVARDEGAARISQHIEWLGRRIPRPSERCPKCSAPWDHDEERCTDTTCTRYRRG